MGGFSDSKRRLVKIGLRTILIYLLHLNFVNWGTNCLNPVGEGGIYLKFYLNPTFFFMLPKFILRLLMAISPLTELCYLFPHILLHELLIFFV